MNFFAKFEAIKLTINDIKTEDKLHFCFNFCIEYGENKVNFIINEAYYSHILDFTKGNYKLVDELQQDNYTEILNNEIKFSFGSDKYRNDFKYKFKTESEKETLKNFLLEFKATIEYLMKN